MKLFPGTLRISTCKICMHSNDFDLIRSLWVFILNSAATQSPTDTQSVYRRWWRVCRNNCCIAQNSERARREIDVNESRLRHKPFSTHEHIGIAIKVQRPLSSSIVLEFVDGSSIGRLPWSSFLCSSNVWSSLRIYLNRFRTNVLTLIATLRTAYWAHWIAVCSLHLACVRSS